MTRTPATATPSSTDMRHPVAAGDRGESGTSPGRLSVAPGDCVQSFGVGSALFRSPGRVYTLRARRRRRHILNLAHRRARNRRIFVRQLRGSSLTSRLGLTVLAASVTGRVVAFVAFLMGLVGLALIVAPSGRVRSRTARATLLSPRTTPDALLPSLCPAVGSGIPGPSRRHDSSATM
jgi:hypothetical protein